MSNESEYIKFILVDVAPIFLFINKVTNPSKTFIGFNINGNLEFVVELSKGPSHWN